MKDAWVGEVKRLLEHDPQILPGETIGAGGETDFPEAALRILDLTEQIPLAAFPHHEWVGHKRGRDIGNVTIRENRVSGERRGNDGKRRIARENADRPHATLVGLPGLNGFRPPPILPGGISAA